MDVAPCGSALAPVASPEFAHDLIKLAIDAHGKFHMVARQVDNAVAQPPQKFDEAQLLRFMGVTIFSGPLNSVRS